jgi:hypothetical protein
MDKILICPLSQNQIPGLLMLEWKPPADYNNPSPPPVRSWNKTRESGQSLRETILSQLTDFGDKVKSHKNGLNFFGQ